MITPEQMEAIIYDLEQIEKDALFVANAVLSASNMLSSFDTISAHNRTVGAKICENVVPIIRRLKEETQ